jgi:ribosomal protein S26
MNFIDKRVSIKHAIAILAKNGIRLDEKGASIILDFLYLVAKTYNKKIAVKMTIILMRNRTERKRRRITYQHNFQTRNSLKIFPINIESIGSNFNCLIKSPYGHKKRKRALKIFIINSRVFKLLS